MKIHNKMAGKYKNIYILFLISGVFVLFYIQSMLHLEINSSGFMERRVEYLQESLDNFAALPTAANFDAHISKFVYWVVIGHLLGIQDAPTVIYYTEIIWWSLALFIIPILLYRLTEQKKLYLTIVLPFITTIFAYPCTHYVSDDKWVYAWVILIGLPMLMIIVRTNEFQEKRKWLIMLSLICGIANSLRVWSGIACFIPATFIVIKDAIYTWKRDKKIHIIFSILFIMGQVLFSQILVMLIGAGYNFLYGGNINLLRFRNQQISPFFQLYIGMGWGNSGITYGDASALKVMAESNLSPNRALLKEIILTIKQNGSKMVSMYLKKAVRGVLMSGYYFTLPKYFYYIVGFIAQLSGWLFFSKKNKKNMFRILQMERRVIIIGIVCYLLSIIPAIIDIPKESTIQGASAVLVVGIMYIGIRCIQEYERFIGKQVK